MLNPIKLANKNFLSSLDTSSEEFLSSTSDFESHDQTESQDNTQDHPQDSDGSENKVEDETSDGTGIDSFSFDFDFVILPCRRCKQVGSGSAAEDR